MKTRHIIIYISLFVFVLGFLTTCATTRLHPEPRQPTDTLIIGQIGETHENLIKIFLEDIQTGEIVNLRYRRQDGYFYWINPYATSYRIVGEVSRKSLGGTFLTDWFIKQSSYYLPAFIQIEDGKVNNLGLLADWGYEYNSLYAYPLYTENHEDTKAWFEEKFPESEWNKKEWVNIKIRRSRKELQFSIKDIAGIWVNTDMSFEKLIVKTDGIWARYPYLTVDKTSDRGTFTIEDSWVDKMENKYFKIHLIVDVGLKGHLFELWKLNESGTTLEINSYLDNYYREGEPAKYPAGINPDPTDSTYYIYYRQ